MHISHPADRRQFLRIAAGFTTGALLSGCGGGGSAPASEAITVVPAASTPTNVAAAPLVPGSHPLNLALNLAYLGSAFYGLVARGIGLPSALTGGVGRGGAATGARAIAFADPAIAGYAAELADDKQAHVAALRTEIGAMAAAQPAMDLSASATGAFSLAAQQAGIVGAGASFDPYVGDGAFLIGGFLIENMVAAAYRTLLVAGGGGSSLVAANLGDAIYHGGLIRSLIDGRAETDAATVAALAKASAWLPTLDGTGGQTLPSAPANIVDADGRLIPFMRDGAQVLRVLYLSGGGGGGFLPAGANGIA